MNPHRFDSVSFHETPLGTLMCRWNQKRIVRLQMPGHELDDWSHAGEPTLQCQRALDRALKLFFAGKPNPIDWQWLDVSERTSFQQEVLHQCFLTQPGETLSYGQLASRAGSPKAARAVGKVMATNRIPLLIPCHRVTASGSGIGGFSAPGGLDTKRWLLQMESPESFALVTS
ncbi:MAG: MGMT family protein [Pirellulales bacterium]